MPPIASRIEYRTGGGELVAEAACAVDGFIAAVYSGTAQMAFVNLAIDGTVTITSGGATLTMQPGGIFELTGPEVQFGGQVRAGNLPTSDPADFGRLWNDNGTVKVSAG